MSNAMRAHALRLIQRNIARWGFHVYLIHPHATPRCCYTIGLVESVGAELVLAGGALYGSGEAKAIIDGVAAALRSGGAVDRPVDLRSLGSFALRRADPSWSRALLLGAFDYYGRDDLGVYQIVPDTNRMTIDVPDLGVPWSAVAEPVWRWLHEEWPYPVPADAAALTNVAALRGGRIIEAARWEDDEWELIANPDGNELVEEEPSVVPLATLLAWDPTLRPVVDLAVGQAIRRDAAGGDWEVWG